MGEPHRRALLTLDDGSHVAYRDVRRFGTWLLLEPGELEPYLGARLARSRWWPRSQRRAWASGWRAAAPSKAALLDQRTLAGLGNIYVDEALGYPGATAAAAGSLDRNELRRLHRAIRRRSSWHRPPGLDAHRHRLRTELGLDAEGIQGLRRATSRATAVARRFRGSAYAGLSHVAPLTPRPCRREATRGPAADGPLEDRPDEGDLPRPWPFPGLFALRFSAFRLRLGGCSSCFTLAECSCPAWRSSCCFGLAAIALCCGASCASSPSRSSTGRACRRGAEAPARRLLTDRLALVADRDFLPYWYWAALIAFPACPTPPSAANAITMQTTSATAAAMPGISMGCSTGLPSLSRSWSLCRVDAQRRPSQALKVVKVLFGTRFNRDLLAQWVEAFHLTRASVRPAPLLATARSSHVLQLSGLSSSARFRLLRAAASSSTSNSASPRNCQGSSDHGAQSIARWA